MEMGTPLLAVRDLDKSLAFYQAVLGMEVREDFGANVVLTGGFCLQTLDTWAEFLGKMPEDIAFGGCDTELYFTAEDFDAFLKTLLNHPEAELVRPPVEHRWGQRAVRFYDPDRHVIEVAEPLSAVCRRFRDSGLTPEGIARRMDVSEDFVRRCLK